MTKVGLAWWLWCGMVAYIGRGRVEGGGHTVFAKVSRGGLSSAINIDL